MAAALSTLLLLGGCSSKDFGRYSSCRNDDRFFAGVCTDAGYEAGCVTGRDCVTAGDKGF